LLRLRLPGSSLFPYTTLFRSFERVRSEFVLRASHELRTPVTGMHMAFGLLRERLKFPPEARENDLLDTIGEEMQRLTQLINDLLDRKSTRLNSSHVQISYAVF